MARPAACGVILAAAAFLAVATPAEAQVHYTLNGYPAPPNIVTAMRAHNLPPGDYWLDAWGNWGLVGLPRPLGNINGGGGAEPRRPSLSERGLLYRPGEILNGR